MAKSRQQRSSTKRAGIKKSSARAKPAAAGQRGGARRAPKKAPKGGKTLRREFGRDG